MQRLIFVIAVAFAAVTAAPAAQEDSRALQRAFVAGMQALEAGDAKRAEAIFRELLRYTDSPRVKLELARTLYVLGQYEESKALFQEVSRQPDTPWRVRDNIGRFVSQIEERTGYLKFGISVVSDSNPRNLMAKKEFSIGNLRVTPTEAPKEMTGLRYSARGWLPLESAHGTAAYVSASYIDYPNGDFDRVITDAGVIRSISESGTLRGKAGLELGTFGGKLSYTFPYIGADSILTQSSRHSAAAEWKLGKLTVRDFGFQDALYTNGTLSLRYLTSESVTTTLGTGLELSHAREEPYSYWGWNVSPGMNWLSVRTAYLLGITASLGSRRYADVDPFFSIQRKDAKGRVEFSLGNKEWRWRDNHLVLIAALEENHSTIEFYSYRKASFSVSVE